MTRSADRLRLALCSAAVVLAGCGTLGKKPEKGPTTTASAPAASTSVAAPAAPAVKPSPAASAPAPAGTTGSKAAAAGKGDPSQRFTDALALLHEHKYTDAQQGFTSLGADFPQYSGPLTDLGILYARNPAARDKAVAAFTQAVKARPDNAIALDWLGILQRQAGQYNVAEQSYLAALKIKPDYAMAHLNLAILYDLYLKRPADALTQYHAYQDAGGKGDLRVTAWIRALEHAKPNTGGASSAP